MLLFQSASAQTDAIQLGRLSVRFSPQHLLFKGIHVDVEKSLDAGSRRSIVFSPRFYAGSTRILGAFTQRGDEQEGEVKGYGAEVLHRVYSSETPHDGVYFAYGVNYHYFDVGFVRHGWLQQKDDFGLEVYKYREKHFSEKINRWEGTATMGVQRPFLMDPMLVDLYIGFGYTNSTISSDYGAIRYAVNAYDIGYSGVRVVGGLKLGLSF
ncbi:hypothetical protein ACFS7Z_14885 [Pontibacter toksunensis]|uniref:DUF3575 domain-containing protein n=1 Tax=Pontibacter toksunensis TaxID=1332631 RepID=A0ABW6BV10_9BACT